MTATIPPPTEPTRMWSETEQRDALGGLLATVTDDVVVIPATTGVTATDEDATELTIVPHGAGWRMQISSGSGSRPVALHLSDVAFRALTLEQARLAGIAVLA